MSISAARAYILTKVQLVDPFLSEQDDAFGDRDISTTQTEKFYKLVFGSADQTNTDGNAYGLIIPLTLSIFSQRNTNEIASFDALYEKAISIRNEILRPCDVKNQPEFSDIVGISIVPSEEVDDDKTYRMDLEFNLRIDNYYS